MDIKPSVQKRFLFISMISGPVALVLTVLFGVYTVLRMPTDIVDVHKELMSYTRAEYFARNYTLAWLAGSSKQNTTIDSMTSASAKLTLNPDPMTVTDLNMVDVLWTPTADPAITEWAFTVSATIIPPGGTSSRNFFRVTLVEKQGAFQAITLPRITTRDIVPIRVNTVYVVSTDVNGVLGKIVSNFMKAFLIPGDSGSMGRYVSEAFTAKPISGAPYSSVKVTGINIADGYPNPVDATPGQSVEIMVTVRAFVSTTTYNTMQFPLRVTMTSNGQWLVDSITEPVNFGEVEAR